MGAKASQQRAPRQGPTQGTPVTLHLYDFMTSGEGQALNGVLRQFGSGAYHCGVEVFGKEWSYRGKANGAPGIFWIRPMTASTTYRESVQMGMTTLPQEKVDDILKAMQKTWPASSYQILKKNCCHFCDELCQKLGLGSIPSWITSLADTGRALEDLGRALDGSIASETPTQPPKSSPKPPLKATPQKATPQKATQKESPPTEKPSSRTFQRLSSSPPGVYSPGSPKPAPPSPWSISGSQRNNAYAQMINLDDTQARAIGAPDNTRLWTIVLLAAAVLGVTGVLVVTKTPVGGKFLSVLGSEQHGQQDNLESPVPSPLQSPLQAPQQHYDCEAGYRSFRTSWSSSKMHWCCQNANRACSHDCAQPSAAVSQMWSGDRRLYCCLYEDIACVPAGQQVAMGAAGAAATAASPYAQEAASNLVVPDRTLWQPLGDGQPASGQQAVAPQAYGQQAYGQQAYAQQAHVQQPYAAEASSAGTNYGGAAAAATLGGTAAASNWGGAYDAASVNVQGTAA